MRGERISDHAKNPVMSRLMVLSRSHDLLTDKNWAGAPLRGVVCRALAPFGVTGQASGRFVIEGQDYDCTPNPRLLSQWDCTNWQRMPSNTGRSAMRACT
ncbi:MAG: hypothetical protein H7245_20230 [Candidatus Saccharibacteria bacterium]|nr:hypothetical protein [Pseudorhodobacter sp.]